MTFRERIEALIVERIVRGRFGRMKLADGTFIAHQSAEFHAWCYGPGYLLFKRGSQP